MKGKELREEEKEMEERDAQSTAIDGLRETFYHAYSLDSIEFMVDERISQERKSFQPASARASFFAKLTPGR